MLWEQDIPHKVKAFLWQMCRCCLPTCLRLQQKGVSCLAICPVCETGLENSWHVFLSCAQSIDCWKVMHFWSSMEPVMYGVESLPEFMFTYMSSLSWDRRETFAMLLWSIWRRRIISSVGKTRLEIGLGSHLEQPKYSKTGKLLEESLCHSAMHLRFRIRG